MQIEIYNPVHGEALPPIRWNYEDVKKWVDDGLANYRGIVYTADTIAQAKKDRARLNKLVDAIDTKRKEMKAHYLQPYEEFEVQARELVAMVKTVSAEIDAQVKAYEEFKKKEKQDEILKLYKAMVGDLATLVPYDRLHNPKWLNLTYSMSTVTEDLGAKIDRISAGLASIDTLGLDDDLAGRVKSRFLQDYDLAGALAEKDRIIREREELERIKTAQAAAQPPKPVAPEYTPPRQEILAPAQTDDDTTAEKVHTITFRIHVTDSQLRCLGEFMRANGIRPERV
jgi:hypothetical protein